MLPDVKRLHHGSYSKNYDNFLRKTSYLRYLFSRASFHEIISIDHSSFFIYLFTLPGLLIDFFIVYGFIFHYISSTYYYTFNEHHASFYQPFTLRKSDDEIHCLRIPPP